MIAYVGVKGDQNTGGIYGFEAERRRITPKGKLAALAGYNYMAVSRDKKYLYAAGKDEESRDLLCGYRIKEGGLLEKAGEVLLNTANDVCHLDISPDGRLAVLTDFADGAVHLHPVEEGRPQALLARVPFAGNGIGPRQERSHPHSARFTPDGRYCLAADLGANAVFSVAWDWENGRAAQVSEWKAPPAAGPRHLAFAPGGIVYVLHEITAEIGILKYCAKTGELVQIGRASALPPMMKDYRLDPGMQIDSGAYLSAADLAVSKDGSRLYASVRGCRNIASFAAGQDGMLTPIGHTPSKGYTRSICLSEDGSYLIGIGEKMDDLEGMLEIFEIDSKGRAKNQSVDMAVPGAFTGTACQMETGGEKTR